MCLIFATYSIVRARRLKVATNGSLRSGRLELSKLPARTTIVLLSSLGEQHSLKLLMIGWLASRLDSQGATHGERQSQRQIELKKLLDQARRGSGGTSRLYGTVNNIRLGYERTVLFKKVCCVSPLATYSHLPSSRLLVHLRLLHIRSL
jgi:hypothetical protein